MTNIAELLKVVSGSMSSILVISAFLVWFIKPIRKSFTRWIMKIAHTDASDARLNKIEGVMDDIADGVKNIQYHLDTHIMQNTEEFQKTAQAQMLSLRCQIRDIYVEHYKTKKLTTRQKRDIHDLFEAYCKLGGNGYILSMFDEMRAWEVEEGL